ncbi:phosphopantetheine-binding protein [Paramaledivibacter caminithermalis]|jgi:acyl carrier protein|uniref:Phosphopantetheine attachment site n=1 Tax=Paramaledivibacter caminithermalis (strain DSM 15212 / CIP 107654 / DViRD3) TaxID=1121301 RepID=A0A1M6PR41_PARC5|nr:phosphopantetheine-binding protein [Paramaledivibacter caminithermalis]SHK10413.1 Phosphopantetheine attachment site [Paramaledivibacter caminithermalis DSM 15212]
MMIEKKVEAYIKELTNEDILDHSMNLFEAGILTSLHVLDLISFIEGTFDLEIPVDEISMNSFGSVDGIVNLIEKLIKA